MHMYYSALLQTNAMNKKNRQGAVGALLDIYEHAISALKKEVSDIPDSALTIVTDPQTSDANCRSVQSILSHVVHAGYGYATSIHNTKHHYIPRPEKTFHLAIEEYSRDLTNVFTYTENIFSEITDDELEQLDNSLKIKTNWGQWYDIEQLTEHAIVHILRHKRQIENIKRKKLW